MHDLSMVSVAVGTSWAQCKGVSTEGKGFFALP